MNYVIWNGRDSREIDGLLICELPPISKPQMRVKETAIDGVDGSIIEELGYESYDKTIAVGLKIGADVDEIIEYFTGNGKVVFSNEPNKYYIARIIKGIDYQRLLRFKKANITLRVQPFKYDYEEIEMQYTNIEEQSISITNDGNYFSKPIITVKGEGTVVLSVNGVPICNYTFPENENTVILDSEKQDAYLDSVDNLRNRQMVGEFPIFKKGVNVISWSGTVESLRIKKYSRWL
jgi:predicted phage tail component-like protein